MINKENISQKVLFCSILLVYLYMILKTEISTLTRSELIRLNQALKEACGKIIGKNKTLTVRTHKGGDSSLYGHYDYEDNLITIYRGSTKNIDKYIQIFIHEWTHSRQKGINRRYNKMDEEYGYWNNPYEVEARAAEKLYKSAVWKKVKYILNKKKVK